MKLLAKELGQVWVLLEEAQQVLVGMTPTWMFSRHWVKVEPKHEKKYNELHRWKYVSRCEA